MTAVSAFSRLGAVLALALMPHLVPAQQNAPEDLRKAAALMDCQQLARMPNAPITVEACEAQKAAFGSLGAAAGTPGGERAGDASMTCAQIIAEMQSSDFAGVSAATAAEGEVAGQELQEAYRSTHARAAALAGRQAGETAAASLAPNAMQGAIAAKHEAEQAALRRSATARVRPAQARTVMANAAAAQELAASLQANPRFARLIQLAAAQNCQVP